MLFHLYTSEKGTTKNLHTTVQPVHSFLPESAGTVRMMSESPGSIMERVLTRKYLPQAVPSDTLSPL